MDTSPAAGRIVSRPLIGGSGFVTRRAQAPARCEGLSLRVTAEASYHTSSFSSSTGPASSAPGRRREHAMLLAELPGRGRDDGPFGDHELAACPNGESNVLLANKVERRAGSPGRGRGLRDESR